MQLMVIIDDVIHGLIVIHSDNPTGVEVPILGLLKLLVQGHLQLLLMELGQFLVA